MWISETIVSCRNPDIYLSWYLLSGYITWIFPYLELLSGYFQVWNCYPGIFMSGIAIQVFSCLELLSRYFHVWDCYLDIFMSGTVIQVFSCLELLSRYFLTFRSYSFQPFYPDFFHSDIFSSSFYILISWEWFAFVIVSGCFWWIYNIKQIGVCQQ